MNLKESILALSENKYNCLESAEIDNIYVITLGNDTDDYALNFEVSPDNIGVNVIDVAEKSVIDNYDAEYKNEDEFKDGIITAVRTYEAIRRLKKKTPVTESFKVGDRIENTEDNRLGVVTEVISNKPEIDDTESAAYAITYDDGQTEMLSAELMKKSNKKKEQKVESIEDTTTAEEPVTDAPAESEAAPAKTIEEIIAEATNSQLINQLVININNASDKAEDELIKRVLNDIALQIEGLQEELDHIL